MSKYVKKRIIMDKFADRVDTVNPVTKKCKAKMRAATIEKGGMNKLRATYNAIDSINEP